jgi:hypothetical protein
VSTEPLVDRDRQRVYDAEEAAFGGTTMDDRLGWDDVEVLVDAVVADAWWASIALPAPRLQRSRADARTSCSDGVVIRICTEGQTALTVVHELAHHVAGHLAWPDGVGEPTPHGDRFRATALRVATVVSGSSGSDALERSWHSHRLSVADWAWPEPDDRAPRALRGARALGGVPPG